MAEADKTLRVGIIGTGWGVRTQIPALRLVSRVAVVAIASSNGEKAKRIAAEHNIAAGYGDYREMLAREQLDLVCITTPPYLHREMVLTAAAAGVNIICEKPFALNVAEAREMQVAAQQAGITHAIDHEFRYLAGRHYMKQLVAQAYLGDVYSVTMCDLGGGMLRPEDRGWNWWMEREKGGGMLGAIGSHYIDTARWIFGEIETVTAQLDTFVKRRPLRDNPQEWRDVTADDTAHLLCRLQSGAALSIHVSGVAMAGKSEICAYGSDGALCLDTRDENILLGARAERDRQLQPITIPTEFQLPQVEGNRLIAPFAELVWRVVAAIDGGHPTAWDVASFSDGVEVQKVLDAARRAAAEGRWVNIRDELCVMQYA